MNPRLPLPPRLAAFILAAAVANLASAACGTRADSVPPASSVGVRPPAPVLELGDAVPDLSLLNQDGRSIRMSDYRGRVVAATFMYTRCPFPDYCPRLMARLARVRDELARDRAMWAQVALVAVTIDPLHDTPDVLRAYGMSMLGPKPFDHLDLVTGEPAAIDHLAASVGVRYLEPSGLPAHTLSTALIDREGRLANVIDGSDWAPEQIAAAISALARSPRGARP